MIWEQRSKMRKISILLFFMITAVSILSLTAAAKAKTITIVLDPGHGGDQSGAARDGERVEEKTLNLKIAQYLKKELESYEDVKVYLTRTGDYDVKLSERTQYAVDKKADVMISLHNNATGECAPYDNGCTVLAAKDGYKDALALEGQKLSCNILKELSDIGLEDQGILLRDSEANEKYPNGELADYYAIIRGGVQNNILTVLVEHAFLDDDADYEGHLSSDAKLKELAQADARGIARYYQLTKKSNVEADQMQKTVLDSLVNYKEKLVHIVDGHARNNKISYKTYYQEQTDNTQEETQAQVQSQTENTQTDKESTKNESTQSTDQKDKKPAAPKKSKMVKKDSKTFGLQIAIAVLSAALVVILGNIFRLKKKGKN